MKLLIYLIVLIVVLRWIGQMFKSNITYVNINNHNQEPKPSKQPNGTTITGNVETKTKGNIGDYVDFEEL